MKFLYLILIISITLFMVIVFPKSSDNLLLENQLKSNAFINNELIKEQKKEARYYAVAYPDYELSLHKGLRRDSLFYAYKEERSISNWKNYIEAFQSENNYDDDFRRFDFASDELNFLNQKTEYEVLSNLLLDSKINYFRYISWTFPMMKIVGSHITFDKFQPEIYQQKAFYQDEKISIPILLALNTIEEELEISEARLNGELLRNNKIKIKATESGKQAFEVTIEGKKFNKTSQFFEFIVE